jgi:ketosteroid isomerase-like protein
MTSPPDGSPDRAATTTSVSLRLRDVQNAHDADGFAALVAPDYSSVQPVHPGREFTGRDQVLTNWAAVFAGVTDFTSELLSLVVEGDQEWAEWHWCGHHTDGSLFEMRGTTIFVVRDGVIVSGRLYMEPVEQVAQDIATAVRELYQGGE